MNKWRIVHHFEGFTVEKKIWGFWFVMRYTDSEENARSLLRMEQAEDEFIPGIIAQ